MVQMSTFTCAEMERTNDVNEQESLSLLICIISGTCKVQRLSRGFQRDEKREGDGCRHYPIYFLVFTHPKTLEAPAIYLYSF